MLLKLFQTDHESAIRDCSKALDLHPHYMKALMRRAELYEKTEKLDEALTDYQKILELDPSQHSARAACMVRLLLHCPSLGSQPNAMPVMKILLSVFIRGNKIFLTPKSQISTMCFSDDSKNQQVLHKKIALLRLVENTFL